MLQLVEDKRSLMARLGRTEAKIALASPLFATPPALAHFGLAIEDEGRVLCYHGAGEGEVAPLLKALIAEGIDFTGIDIHESSLEDIFVDLIGRNHHGSEAR